MTDDFHDEFNDISLQEETRDAKISPKEGWVCGLSILVFALVVPAFATAMASLWEDGPMIETHPTLRDVIMFYIVSIVCLLVMFTWFLFYFVKSTKDVLLSQMIKSFLWGICAFACYFSMLGVPLFCFWIATIFIMLFFDPQYDHGNVDATIYFVISIVTIFGVTIIAQLFCFRFFLRFTPKEALVNRFSGALYGLSFGVGFSFLMSYFAVMAYWTFVAGDFGSYGVNLTIEKSLLATVDYLIFSVALNVLTGVWIGWTMNFDKFSNPHPLSNRINFGSLKIQIIPVYLLRATYFFLSGLPFLILVAEFSLYSQIWVFSLFGSFAAGFSGSTFELIAVLDFNVFLILIPFSSCLITFFLTIAVILIIRKVSLSYLSVISNHSLRAEAFYEDL